MISRRRLLQLGGMAGAAVLLPFKWNVRKAFAASPMLKKFGPGQGLPGLGSTGIPVLSPFSTAGGMDTYKILLGQFKQKLHPDLNPTTLWGYAQDVGNVGSPNFRYLGGVIVAQKGRPVKLIAKNILPNAHILPVDTSIPGAESNQAQNRAAIHLHGGLVPWIADGGPFAWFTPAANWAHGSSFMNGTGTPGEAQYYYPNDQSARLMWYHDHAVGITRLNAYAGLATAYIIRDAFEQALLNGNLIPSREIPLILQDKSFNDDGSLYYASLYDGEISGGTPPAISVVPEFFGDTAVVNGMAYPFAQVERRHYRFRILNAAQSSFYNLQLYYADTSTPEMADLTKPGPKMIQIGTEGGFLPFPVALNDPPVQIGFDPITGNANAYTLLLGPAERADLIIDFSGCPAGSRLILYNDAPGPFPGGDPPPQGANQGPDVRNLLQFQVVTRVGKADPPSLNIIPALAVKAEKFFGKVNSGLLPAVPKLESRLAVRTRDLTLNEAFDSYGRLIQYLGTNVANADGSFGRPFEADPTETPKAGTCEIWRIFNLTADTHPIHFHLVNVQVLSRRQFNVDNYNGGAPGWLGPAVRPDLNEMGWKETVRMNPGEMTEVIMKFDLPKVPFTVPLSERTTVKGYEYVWHCHILEHEEHDMMRPLIVTP